MRAVELAGSNSALATAIGCSATAVWKMVNKAHRLSVDYVLTVEKLYGISRHDLRPDIYPREPQTPAHPPGVSKPVTHSGDGTGAGVAQAKALAHGSGSGFPSGTGEPGGGANPPSVRGAIQFDQPREGAAR
ncbi:transcriptional regulator [Novosphingopyxis sp. YJ-S2-01]|uniref:transcriptional regulator n=1 Tax=Novosphingopyxis sp. YJ-S2-01 TaxID=2794021 RepID=UPI003FA58F48